MRLAGEQFGISKTAVYWKYAKFGVGIPAVGAVLDEVQKKSIVWSCQLLYEDFSWLTLHYNTTLKLQHSYTTINKL